mmetsp:Transcript_22241/g.60772  ORF Transcript_22241/g.60772 Transcript_22241/m.60772 type:complete len:110 (+) Transcript_22241:452-781(+)
MAPEWKSLAATIHKEYSGMIVVSVDCEASAEVCGYFGVQGYPTILLLRATKTPQGEAGYDPVRYEQAREAGAMLAFIRQQGAARARRPVWGMIKALAAKFLAIKVTMPK